MKCPYCNETVKNGSKFCTNCGSKLPVGEDNLDHAVFQAMNAKEELDQQFARDFSSSEAEDDILFENDVYTVEAVEEEENPEEEWFYVDQNNSTMGPYTLEGMIDRINNGTLSENSYIWKDGMDNWQLLATTELRAYLPGKQTWQSSTQGSEEAPYFQGREAYRNPDAQGYFANQNLNVQSNEIEKRQPQRPYRRMDVVHPRSIILYILLYFLTCGLMSLVWLYQEAKDVNTLLASQNQPVLPSPAIVVLLSLVTCNFYDIIYFYQAGKRLSQLRYRSYNVPDDAIAMALLSVLTGNLVAEAILQSTLNDIARLNDH